MWAPGRESGTRPGEGDCTVLGPTSNNSVQLTSPDKAPRILKTSIVLHCINCKINMSRLHCIHLQPSSAELNYCWGLLAACWPQGAGGFCARDKGPGTGGKGPGTRDKAPGTGDKGPGTGDRGPGTRDKGPGTRDQGPRTDQGPGTRDQGQGTRLDGRTL